jgi:hypothetical protein
MHPGRPFPQYTIYVEVIDCRPGGSPTAPITALQGVPVVKVCVMFWDSELDVDVKYLFTFCG